jgi:hypothetical protein
MHRKVREGAGEVIHQETAFALEEQVIALDFLKDTFKALEYASQEGAMPQNALYFPIKELDRICERLDAIKNTLFQTMRKEKEA